MRKITDKIGLGGGAYQHGIPRTCENCRVHSIGGNEQHYCRNRRNGAQRFAAGPSRQIFYVADANPEAYGSRFRQPRSEFGDAYGPDGQWPWVSFSLHGRRGVFGNLEQRIALQAVPAGELALTRVVTLTQASVTIENFLHNRNQQNEIRATIGERTFYAVGDEEATMYGQTLDALLGATAAAAIMHGGETQTWEDFAGEASLEFGNERLAIAASARNYTSDGKAFPLRQPEQLELSGQAGKYLCLATLAEVALPPLGYATLTMATERREPTAY